MESSSISPHLEPGVVIWIAGDFPSNQEKQDKNTKKKTYSNDMRDACKTICKICAYEVSLKALRNHTRSKHGITITVYKEMFGTNIKIIEEIYHKCGICGKSILLDSDSVVSHLKKRGHSTTHKQYNKKFMNN